MTHDDLASLSVAHEHDPHDDEILARYHQALCRIFGHLANGVYVGIMTEAGGLGSYCSGRHGCPVCSRCNQVVCEHADRYEPRAVGTTRCWTRPGEGDLVPEREDY